MKYTLTLFAYESNHKLVAKIAKQLQLHRKNRIKSCTIQTYYLCLQPSSKATTGQCKGDFL